MKLHDWKPLLLAELVDITGGRPHEVAQGGNIFTGEDEEARMRNREVGMLRLAGYLEKKYGVQLSKEMRDEIERKKALSFPELCRYLDLHFGKHLQAG